MTEPWSPADEPEDPDLGEPVRALALLRHEPTPGLVGRIRRSIQRRMFASQVVDLSWSGPRHVFAEFLGLIFALFGKRSARSGEEKR
jgi:hypothetical protein